MKPWQILLGVGVLLGGAVLMSQGSTPPSPSPRPTPPQDTPIGSAKNPYRFYLYATSGALGVANVVMSLALADGTGLSLAQSRLVFDKLKQQPAHAHIVLMAARVKNSSMTDAIAKHLTEFGHVVTIDSTTPTPAMPTD